MSYFLIYSYLKAKAMNKSVKIFLLPSILLFAVSCNNPGNRNQPGNKTSPDVLVIDDFERSSAPTIWEGTISYSNEHPSHGRRSGRFSFRKEGLPLQMETLKMPEDWSRFDHLKFDIYNPSFRLQYGSIQIFDISGSDEDAEFHGQSYNGEGKLFLNTGWNHFDFLLHNAMVEEGNRPLLLSHIRRLRLYFGGVDTTLYIDNIRLAAGEETSATASRIKPGDCIVTIDNRNVYTSLAGPPELIRTGREINRLRITAQSSVDKLRKNIHVAQLQGFQTLYQGIPLITADVGLGIRSNLVWFQNEVEEKKILEYVIGSCNRASDEISAMLSSARTSGVTTEPEDEVNSASYYVPPYPPLKDLKAADGFYRDKTGAPVLVFSMLQIDDGPLLDYFAPFDHRLESYTVGGGSRYNIESSPVYEAFHKYPGTHRVGWDGWCGHLIKDRWAMGGKKEDVVICLESTEIRQAVLEYMKIYSPEWKNNPDLLYNIMAYELQYICYCDKSCEMFRDWLRVKYGMVSELNSTWNTSYSSFNEIVPPATHNARPVDDVNRGAWYDWACFNSRRFTDYLKWVKVEMRKLETVVPICAGGTSSMLSSSNSVTGIDEEMIINEVDDVILNESGGSQIFSDLLLSLSNERKVMVDPEMGSGIHNLLLQFLHGKSDISKWWWGAYPSREFMEMNQTSLPHSKEISLADIDEVLKTGLDVRRLAGEITEFTRYDPEIAILYSKTSIIQVPPKQIQEGRTPYIDAVYSVWEGARFLGCRIGFISEKQILERKLEGFKILIIPAVKYIVPEVVAEIRNYLTNGGTVLVIPETFSFDQYARKTSEIQDFGIKISDITLPEIIGSKEKQQNYDQSFSQPVIYGNVNRTIKPIHEDIFSGFKPGADLHSDGLVQSVDPGKNQVLAEFDDGKPAIILVRNGKGSLYYLASPLRSDDYHLILAPMAEKARVTRPVTAVDTNGDLITGAEVRSVERKNDYLVYASNLTSRNIGLDFKGESSLGKVTDLRNPANPSGSHIVLFPFQETIYRIEKSK